MRWKITARRNAKPAGQCASDCSASTYAAQRRGCHAYPGCPLICPRVPLSASVFTYAIRQGPCGEYPGCPLIRPRKRNRNRNRNRMLSKSATGPAWNGAGRWNGITPSDRRQWNEMKIFSQAHPSLVRQNANTCTALAYATRRCRWSVSWMSPYTPPLYALVPSSASLEVKSTKLQIPRAIKYLRRLPYPNFDLD